MSTYEKLFSKKTNTSFKQGYRKIANVDEKYHNDFIWLFWEIVLNLVKIREIKVKNQVFALYRLFIYEYSPNKKAKKMLERAAKDGDALSIMWLDVQMPLF